MSTPIFNKYRAAIELLQRGRDTLMEGMTDEILAMGDDLPEAGYQFQEFLETQGTRMHFLSLLIGQLEQSADAFDEAHAPPKPTAKRRSRTKRLPQQTTKEEPADDV